MRPRLIAASAATILFVACSGDAGATAEALIETELAEQLDIGVLEATCDQPDDLVAGAEFSCTATNGEGATIELDARFVEDDRFEVWAVNAIPKTDLPALEADIARALGEQSGVEIPVENADCGEESVILGGGTFTCELTDPTDDSVYEVTVSTAGYDGETLVDLFYEITDQLR